MRACRWGPDWSDVERLIRHCNQGSRPEDIRDKAILELLAIYGLRAGEVTRLCLEGLNWSQDRILVTRPKQRRSHENPLLPCIGESILRYQLLGRALGAGSPSSFRAKQPMIFSSDQSLVESQQRRGPDRDRDFQDALRCHEYRTQTKQGSVQGTQPRRLLSRAIQDQQTDASKEAIRQ